MIDAYVQEAITALQKTPKGFALQDIHSYILKNHREWYRFDQITKAIRRVNPGLVVCMRREATNSPTTYAYRLTQDEGNSYTHYHVGCFTGEADEVPVQVEQIADSAVCVHCKLPIQPCPYVVQDTVIILPGYRREYSNTLYLLVEGVEWRPYGVDSGQWVITQATQLKQHDYDPSVILLTTIKRYEVPTFHTLKAYVQWRDMGVTKHKLYSEV